MALLGTGKHYLWAIFLYQQALEKAFKAVYFEQNGEVPPRKHDLVALSKLTDLIGEYDEKRLDFLHRLTVCYIETRYPEEKAELAAKCTEEYTNQIAISMWPLSVPIWEKIGWKRW